jgi:hypothetical protein
VDPSNLPGVWQAFLGLIASHGPMLHSLLAQGRLVALEEDRAVIRFGPQHETFVRMWERNGKKDLVRDAISQVLNQSIGVKFEIDASDASGPTQAPVAPKPAPRAQTSRPAPAPAPEPPAPIGPPAIKITPDLVDSIRNAEPLVKELMERLGAQIIKVE